MITLYTDTREQKPLDFSSCKIIDKQELVTLPYGDYACEYNGKLIPVVFDRKGLGDLFGTLSKGHKRFMREVEKAQKDNVLLILIIEKNLSTIIKGYRYSKMKGTAIIKQMFTLLHKHNVPFYCCTDRKEMVFYIINYFASYIKNKLS